MPPIMTLSAVEHLCITVSYGVSLEAIPHDVFLLEGRIPESAGPFDATSLLGVILPELRSSDTDPLVVHVGYTHHLGADPRADAEIAIVLTTDGSLRAADLEAVRAAFRGLLGLLRGETAATLSHDDALPAARTRVARVYPGVHAASLRVTDEEHLHDVWSIGLTDDSLDRYEVSIGFVDEDTATTHFRHLPASEVVDSVGTG